MPAAGWPPQPRSCRRGRADPRSAARATRALEAAHAKHDAGASKAALELRASAAAGHWTSCNTRGSSCCRAQIAFHLTRGSNMTGMCPRGWAPPRDHSHAPCLTGAGVEPFGETRHW
ncbi:hypothetical protein E1266_35065 [Actinomadura sp. 7K534]|nr:hypothetical protein E1266_35065 [Actinomadura sp. 7K534]